MRELVLRKLEREIRAQRLKVAADRLRVEQAVSELPGKALRAVASPGGLLVSFSLGAAAAGLPRSHGLVSLLAWDLLRRAPLDGLPLIGELIRNLRPKGESRAPPA